MRAAFQRHAIPLANAKLAYHHELVILGLQVLLGSLVALVYLMILQHYRNRRHLQAEMMGQFHR